MNPRILEPILEGYKLKRKIIDENQWLLGGYIFDAVSIAIGNMGKKKGQKPDNYFEAIKKPVLSSVNLSNNEMTEEEKQKRREILMASLRIRQANFELSKKKKEQ